MGASSARWCERPNSFTQLFLTRTFFFLPLLCVLFFNRGSLEFCRNSTQDIRKRGDPGGFSAGLGTDYRTVSIVTCWREIWIRQRRHSEGLSQNQIRIFPPFGSHKLTVGGSNKFWGSKQVTLLVSSCSRAEQRLAFMSGRKPSYNQIKTKVTGPLSTESFQRFLIEVLVFGKQLLCQIMRQNKLSPIQGSRSQSDPEPSSVPRFWFICLSCQPKHWVMGRNQVQDGTGAKIQYLRIFWGPDYRKVKQNNVWC